MGSPKVTEDQTNEVRCYTRSIEFAGVDPILIERNYSHGGKLYAPDHAFARWNHGQAVEIIKASGAVVKKDGTPGTAQTQVEYITPAHRYWGRNSPYYTEAPAWLLELFGFTETTTKEMSN